MKQNPPETKPFIKRPRPVITGNFEIGEDGRVSFELTDGTKITPSPDRLSYRVGLGMLLVSECDKLWYRRVWLNGGGGVATVDMTVCRFCDQAINAGEMIHSANGDHCPSCDATFDAINAEFDRYEELRAQYQPGDLCPAEYHDDYWCEFCDHYMLTPEGSAMIHDELKCKHEKRLTKLADSVPHSPIAKQLTRDMALRGLRLRRDPHVDPLPW